MSFVLSLSLLFFCHASHASKPFVTQAYQPEIVDSLLDAVLSEDQPWKQGHDLRDDLLVRVSELSLAAPYWVNFKGSELEKSINLKMHRLLRKFYSISQRRGLVEEIFERLDLWGAEDLETLAQRFRTGRLRYYIRPLLKALSEASEGEIENFAIEVRLGRTRSNVRDRWVGYLMLLKFMKPSADDIEMLFRTLIMRHLEKSFITGEATRLSPDPKRFKDADEMALKALTMEMFAKMRTQLTENDPEWVDPYAKFLLQPGWQGQRFSREERVQIFIFLEWIRGGESGTCAGLVENGGH